MKVSFKKKTISLMRNGFIYVLEIKNHFLVIEKLQNLV